MKVRKRLYNKAKRSNSQDDWKAYCKLKDSINTSLKEAHNFRLFDNSFSGNCRKFWSYIRAKRQDIAKHDIPTLFINDQPIYSAIGKPKG